MFTMLGCALLFESILLQLYYIYACFVSVKGAQIDYSQSPVFP